MKFYYLGIALLGSLFVYFQSPGAVDTGAAADDVGMVLSKHREFVANDPGLSSAHRERFLAGEEWFWETIMNEGEGGRVRKSVFQRGLRPILDRHDQYVYGLDTLTETEKRVYLERSRGLRALWK